jgi:chromosome partitioning protein
MKAKIIDFLCFKGGVGPKTTAAVETCTILSKRNKQILLIDSDPQLVCATRSVGIDPDKAMPNLYHVFRKQVPPQDAIQKTKFGFDLLPSNSLMDAIDDALEKVDDLLLRSLLEPLKEDYDYIVIDPPPGRRRITINGVLASDWLIIPITANTHGLEAANDTIRFVQEKLLTEYPDQIASQDIRILFSRFKHGRNSHAPGVKQAAKKVYSNNVLDFEVPDSLVEFSRSYGKGQPLASRLPKHPASKVYNAFADWFIANIT